MIPDKPSNAVIPLGQLPPSHETRATLAPLWRQISDGLRESIEAGRLPLGGKLPSEASLAKHYSVNRHTIRHAIAYLSNDGLVSAARGRGTFVTGGQRIEYDLLGGDRQLLKQGMREARAQTLPIARSLNAAGKRLSELLEIPESTGCFNVEVRIAFAGLPIGLLRHQLPSERLPKFMDRFIKSSSVGAALDELGYADLKSKRQRFSARSADAREAKLLNLEPGAPVVVYEAILKQRGGDRIALEEGVFSASSVCLKHGD